MIFFLSVRLFALGRLDLEDVLASVVFSIRRSGMSRTGSDRLVESVCSIGICWQGCSTVENNYRLIG